MYQKLKQSLEELNIYTEDLILEILAKTDNSEVVIDFIDKENINIASLNAAILNRILYLCKEDLQKFYINLDNEDKIKLVNKASGMAYVLFPIYSVKKRLSPPTVNNLYSSYTHDYYHFIHDDKDKFYDYMIKYFSFVIEGTSLAKAFDRNKRNSLSYYSKEQNELIAKLVKYKIENYKVNDRELTALCKNINYWLDQGNHTSYDIKTFKNNDILRGLDDLKKYLINNVKSKAIIKFL